MLQLIFRLVRKTQGRPESSSDLVTQLKAMVRNPVAELARVASVSSVDSAPDPCADYDEDDLRVFQHLQAAFGMETATEPSSPTYMLAQDADGGCEYCEERDPQNFRCVRGSCEGAPGSIDTVWRGPYVRLFVRGESL